MGKIVMPKNSALLEEVEAVLKIYYEASGWLSNDEYKNKLKNLIGDDQYSSSYTKKSQITSYFGFTEWEDINNVRSLRRITNRGKIFYRHILEKNTDGIVEDLVTSLEEVTFGRKNFGCPDSDSDVEPPVVFVRSILELGYLTYKEYAYLLWKLEDCGANYTDCLREIRQFRKNNGLILEKEAQKYTDAKPIMVLIRWGLLNESETIGGNKTIIIPENNIAKYETRIRNLKIYNIDKAVSNTEYIDKTSETEDGIMENTRPFINLNFTTNLNYSFERNIIVFGAPGTGKSYQIEQNKNSIMAMGGGYERVTFHPDYTYSSFVGCYKPVSEKGKIEYKFVPGPFMRVLVEALRSAMTDNPKPYLLIIEEINRAKVAAVFGEVFQLLDRDSNGVSEYEIHTSDDIKNYLSDELNGSIESFERIRIPNNMFIWATMNSADQGVFPMDTAFKRRWSFEYKGIDENEDKISGRIVLGENEHEFEVDWNVLRKAINEVLSKKYKLNEDKLIGPFFIKKDVLLVNEEGYIKDPEKFKKVFKNKVLMYLYEDAAKQVKNKLFAGCDSTRYSSVCDAFDMLGIDIFGIDFKDTYNNMGQSYGHFVGLH